MGKERTSFWDRHGTILLNARSEPLLQLFNLAMDGFFDFFTQLFKLAPEGLAVFGLKLQAWRTLILHAAMNRKPS